MNDRRLHGRRGEEDRPGVQETTGGIGKTLTEGVMEVQQRAKVPDAESRPAGEKLEKSAQGFGESVWDGMKFPAKVFTGG